MAARAVPNGRDWTVSPGEILAELLEERDLSQSELARRMGRPAKTINEIVNAKAAITPQTAIQLERVLGTSASFWVNAEAAFRHDLARFAESEALEGQTSWLERFPVRDLVREGIIDRGSSSRQIDQLLQFFGVGSTDAWESQWGSAPAAYRQPAGSSSKEARAVWLRWGQIAAGERHVSLYDPDKAAQLAPRLARLSIIAPPQAAVDELEEELAEVGIRLVLLPEITGTRLSGAAHWLATGEPVLQLSARHRRDDHFWFTVLHELGHIIDAPMQTFTDSEGGSAEPRQGDAVDQAAEERADHVARESLVPSDELAAFLARARADDRAAVRAFARALGIAPGIVVGRLQRDRHLDWSQLNDLKRSYELF